MNERLPQSVQCRPSETYFSPSSQVCDCIRNTSNSYSRAISKTSRKKQASVNICPSHKEFGTEGKFRPNSIPHRLFRQESPVYRWKSEGNVLLRIWKRHLHCGQGRTQPRPCVNLAGGINSGATSRSMGQPAAWTFVKRSVVLPVG